MILFLLKHLWIKIFLGILLSSGPADDARVLHVPGAGHHQHLHVLPPLLTRLLLHARAPT